MLSKAIIGLLRTKPFYAHFVASMKQIADTSIPTAGVNITTSVNLYYNPDFWSSLPEVQQIAILEHEVHHILYNHISRGEGLNHAVHNISTDCAINGYIGGLPEGSLYPEKLGLKRYRTSEEYYNTLIKRADKLLWGMCVAGKGKDGKDKDGKGECRGTLDDHGKWGKGNKDDDYVKEKIKQVVNKVCDALDSEGKGIGNLPAHLQDLIKKLRKPPLNWKLILRRFLYKASYAVNESTRKRPNKRFGMAFPGSKTQPRLKLGVAVDTSGSIDDYFLNVFFNEVEHINNACAEVWVIECDAEVGRFYKYNPKTFDPHVTGRGGTAFQPAIDKATELQVDALCYLTDGQNCDTPKRPHFPVLWALTENNKRPVEWGNVVKIIDERKAKTENETD